MDQAGDVAIVCLLLGNLNVIDIYPSQKKKEKTIAQSGITPTLTDAQSETEMRPLFHLSGSKITTNHGCNQM